MKCIFYSLLFVGFELTLTFVIQDLGEGGDKNSWNEGTLKKNQICFSMSSTILEKTRFLQEDIEKYEKAIEAELDVQPKTVSVKVEPLSSSSVQRCSSNMT